MTSLSQIRPEYAFPNNCYSDSQNLSRITTELAAVSATIGVLEDFLMPARRPRARVAIVAARSSSYWDGWKDGNGPTLAGGTVLLLHHDSATGYVRCTMNSATDYVRCTMDSATDYVCCTMNSATDYVRCTMNSANITGRIWRYGTFPRV